MANLKRAKKPSKPPTGSKKKKKPSKFELKIVKSHLISKSGTLKKKTKDNLKLLDNILKSELLIGKKRNTRSKTLRNPKSKCVNVNNNQVGVNNNNRDEPNINTDKNGEKNPPSNGSLQSEELENDSDDQIFKKPFPKTTNFKKRGKKPIQPRTSIVLKRKHNNKDVSKGDNHDELEQISETTFIAPKKPKVVKQAEKTPAIISNEGSKQLKQSENNKNKETDIQVNQATKELELTKDNKTNSKVPTKATPKHNLKFECDYCQKVFNKKSQVRRHLYIHTDIKPYKCKHCRKRFRHKCNRQVHMIRKHVLSAQIERFICDHCNKPFLLKDNLSVHLSNHTQGIVFFKCAFCDKKFSNHFNLSEHESHHLKTSKYKCSTCNAGFAYRLRLAAHVKTHKNDKDFICQYCGKEFLRPHSIKRHVEVCHSGFRIQCPICHKKLKGHLTEHLRTHEKSKPHKCPDCGQRFTQSTQLTVHRRSHTGAKPYECRICKKNFSHSNAMLLHFRRHTGEKPFPCAMCPMSFTQLPHMKNHMHKIHGRMEAYKCHKCSEFFKMKKQLDKHLKTCLAEPELSIEEKEDVAIFVPELDSVMSLSRMRFLLALLLTMVASKSKLKCLGFNKRLIDDLLIDSLEAMDQTPCKDLQITPLRRLKINIELLLVATIPEEQLKKFQEDEKTIEEILELLTDDKTSCTKIL